MPNESERLNRNLETKRNDKFYVSFFGIPDNYSNFLAGRVISIDRPIIAFDVAELYNKMRRSQHTTITRYDNINIEFSDDIGGLVWNLLKGMAIQQNQEGTKEFDIRIDMYDNENILCDRYHIRNCKFTTIGKGQLAYADSSMTIITVNVAYEKFEFDQPCE